MSFGRDAISDGYVGDEPADLYDVTGELVSHDEGRFAAGAGPVVPFVDVHVGAADAGTSNANEYFVLTNFGNGNVGKGKAGSCAVLDERSHGAIWRSW